MIERELRPFFKGNAQDNLVFLSGPRSCGKSSFVSSLFSSIQYLDFEKKEDRNQLLTKSWASKEQGITKDNVLLSGINKIPDWEKWLKEKSIELGPERSIIISLDQKIPFVMKPKLNLFNQSPIYHLYPFCLKELKNFRTPLENYEAFLKFGNFPEPFLRASEEFSQKWRAEQLDIGLRQDLQEGDLVKDFALVKSLIYLLQEAVGRPVIFDSLAQVLNRDPKTIKRWVELLEKYFIIFKVEPFSRRIPRALTKESKYYFYDVGQVQGSEEQKLENLVALSVKKELSLLKDVRGIDGELYYLRTRNKQFLDFITYSKGRPAILIDVSVDDSTQNPHFKYFSRFFKNCVKIQLVKNLGEEFISKGGVEVKSAIDWLAN